MFNSAIYPKNLLSNHTSTYMNLDHFKHSAMLTIRAVGRSEVDEKKQYYSVGQIAELVKRSGSFDYKDALAISAFLIHPVDESFFDLAVTLARPGNPDGLKKPKWFDMDLAALILTDVFMSIYPLKTSTTVELFNLVDEFLKDFKEDAAIITPLSDYTHEQLSRRMVKNLIRNEDGDVNYSTAMADELEMAMGEILNSITANGITYPAGLMALSVYPKLKNPYRTATWLFREYLQNHKPIFATKGPEKTKLSLTYAAEFIETLWFQCAKNSEDVDAWPVENLPNTYYTYSTPLKFPLMNFEKLNFQLIPKLQYRFMHLIIEQTYLWQTKISPVEAMNGMVEIYKEAEKAKNGDPVLNINGISPTVSRVLKKYFDGKSPSSITLRQYRSTLLRYYERDKQHFVDMIVGSPHTMANSL